MAALLFIGFSVGHARECTESEAITELDSSRFLESPQSALDYIDGLRGFRDCDFTVRGEIVTQKSGKTTHEYVIDIKVGRAGQSLVEVVSPPRERGRKILRVEQDIWLYLPGTRNTIRIAPLQRVFGMASMSDLLGVSYSRDYEASDVQVVTCDTGECLEVTALLRDGKSGFSTVIFYLTKNEGRLVRSKHMTSSQREIQQVEYLNMAEVAGHPKLEKLKIINLLRPENITWLRYSDYRPVDLGTREFSRASLGR